MANDPLAPPSNELSQNSTLGKYLIQRKVGSGGMGAVYLAIDQQLKRTVALKVLPRDKAANKVLVRRFKAEGQAGAQLEHPNIVAVYESGEIDGYLYLAMEFVEGIDAFELLRKRGILPVKRSLEIVKQVAQALQHAHERQVVHRDIKPSNLMIRERDGVVKLADMGLARIIEDEGESAITKAGTTVGTVDYMSPEQGRDSKAADIRSDIYSLGCTWFHLVCGKSPYSEGDLMNKLRAHALQPVPDPRTWNESIPPGVVAVIQRMMAKKPDDRYQTPEQLLAELSSPALLRGDFSAEQLSLLGSAHAQENEFEREGEEVLTKQSTGGGRKQPRSVSGNQVTRSELPVRSHNQGAIDSDIGADDDVDQSPSATRTAPRKSAGRDALPARTVTTGMGQTSGDRAFKGAQSPQTERALPARIDRQDMVDVPTSTIDPNHLKLGLLVFSILFGLGTLLYLIRSFTGSPASNDGSNPYANGDSSPPPATLASNTAPPSTGGAETPANQNPPAELPTTKTSQVKEPLPAAIEPSSNAGLSGVAIDQTPFAGEVEYSMNESGPVPSWIWQSRSPVSNAREIVIRRGSPRGGEFRSVGEALTHVHGDLVVTFADPGPHDLPELSLKSPHRWTLRGADGIHPMLVLPTAQPVNVQTGTLVFDRVHLVALSDQVCAAVRVQSGTLVLKNSSITHLGVRATEVVHADASARVLIEYGLIRTAGTGAAILLQGERTSCVAGQSMIIAPHGQAIGVQSQDAVSDRRQITLLSSVCLAGEAAILFEHQGKQPPHCGLHWMKSIAVYVPGHTAEGVAIHFKGWPKAVEALDQPRPAAVTFAIERSTFAGWPHWAKLEFADQSDPIDVRDEDSWRAFWRQAIPTGTLIPDGGQLQAVMESSALVAPSVVESGLTSILSQLNGIGPRWSNLPSPPTSTLQNICAFGECPRVSLVANSPETSTPLRFDLKRPTLGRFLNSPECPDGAIVVAFGSGLRTIDPFVLRQKRIELIFEQAEGVPLTLQPGYKTEPGTMKPPAWMAVEDGQLTITNGFFRLVSSSTRPYPDRILQLSGGVVVVRHCRFEMGDSTWPMVELLPSQGHAPPQLLFDRTILAGQKNLVRVSAAESLLEVRESILASLSGVTITMETPAAGSQSFLNRSTLSAGRAVYQVRPLDAKGPLQLYSRETLFQGGGILDLETHASAIRWWAIENAYSSQMKKFLITEDTGKTQSFQNDWVAGWGAGHELLALYGENQTIMPEAPLKVNDVVPMSFQLHTDCAAAKAGDQGTGIGAPVGRVGPQRDIPPKSTSPQKPTSPEGGPPKKTIPNF